MAERLAGSLPEMIRQEDVFFACSSGRLKLRILASDRGELIFYQRSDAPGPRTSTYSISQTDNPAQLCEVLTAALGEVVRVRKLRRLLLVGRTRIHIDTVEGLGDFLELEVVLDDGEPVEAGQAEAERLMRALEVAEADLIDVAYADLLLRQSES